MSDNNVKTKSGGAAKPTKRSKPTQKKAASKAAKQAAKPAKQAAKPAKPAKQTAKATKAPKQTAKAAAKAPAQRPAKSDASSTGALDSVREKVSAVKKAGPPDLRSFVSAHRVPVIACAAVLVLVVALYGPACGLYQAWRENGVLQEEQAQTSVESDELEGDIANLMTEEGIKDEARRRGYVDEGETRIVVEGLETDDDSTEEEEDDTPWYLRVGDFLFQYERSDEEK